MSETCKHGITIAARCEDCEDAGWYRARVGLLGRRVTELEKAIERIEAGVSEALSMVDEYEDCTTFDALKKVRKLFETPIAGERLSPSVSTSRPAWTGCEHPGVESFERNGGTFLFWCKACGAVSDDDNENWSDPPRLLRKMHEALRSIAALEGNEQAFDWEEFAKSLQARAKAALEESTEEEDNGR